MALINIDDLIKEAEQVLQSARDSYFTHKRQLASLSLQVEDDSKSIKYWEGYIVALKHIKED